MNRRESDRSGRRGPVSRGRRRFDGVSIEQLWDRLEALTRQTQEHAHSLDELPALLAKIEAGLALLERRPRGARGVTAK